MAAYNDGLVQKELDEQTFNHSNRVFVYGSALVKTHFPEWKFNENATAVETYALSCLLHDIGTAERFLATTHMSFEFKGAIVARDLILGLGGPEGEADSVCDAIIRHQDIFVKGYEISGISMHDLNQSARRGNITMVGQILQLSTILGKSSFPSVP